MLTEKEFIEKFDTYSDEELFTILHNSDDYGDDAKKALHYIIEKRGGEQRLRSTIEEKNKELAEIRRIQKETMQMGMEGIDKEFILKTASSEILSAEKVQQIIGNQYDHTAAELEDRKVDEQIIGRCIIAGLIATLVTGSAFGALLIYTEAVSALILVGIALSCYGIIKGITKRSKHNTAVFVTTFIAFSCSTILGYLLLQYFKTRG